MWQTQYLFFDNLYRAIRAQRSSSSEVNIVECLSRWLKFKPRPLSHPEPFFVFIPVATSPLAALSDLDRSIISDPMDCSPPGSSVHGILQASTLEWIAISFSRGPFLPKDWTWVLPTTGSFFTIWATREAPWIEAISPKFWPFHEGQSPPLLFGAKFFSLGPRRHKDYVEGIGLTSAVWLYCGSSGTGDQRHGFPKIRRQEQVELLPQAETPRALLSPPSYF